MSIFSVLLVTGLVLCLIYFAAQWGDGKLARPFLKRHSGLIYGLSLGVYFTSWTFYGAVGTASIRGWDYLPIYLGPLLAFTLGFPIIKRLVRVGQDYGSTSVSDFLSYRYGKSSSLAAIASMIALFGALPYIALQLTSIRDSLQAIGIAAGDGTSATSLIVATALALFAIIFGASTADVTRHNRGLVLAVALETVIKLFALILVAGLALVSFGWSPSVDALTAPDSALMKDFDFTRFLTITALAFTAIFCLPRQFQVMVVECQDDKDLRLGRIIMIGALIVTSIVVLPISAAGINLVNGSAPADMYVLSVPMKLGSDGIAMIAFAGGIAASTGMVIIASLALSTMITNDHVRASQLRLQKGKEAGALPSAERQLQLRRVIIIGILAAAYAFSEGVTNANTLASLGLLAFASASQLGPALFGGLFWSGANRQGAIAGLLSGFFAWLILLALPAYGIETWSFDAFDIDPFASGALVSLFINVTCFIVGSRLTAAGISERMEARRVSAASYAQDASVSQACVGDLVAVVEHSLGIKDAKNAFKAYEKRQNRKLRSSDLIEPPLASYAERQIARVMGAASAKIVIAAVLKGEHSSVAEISVLLGDARDRMRFNHEILEATLDNMSQGVCVIDADMKLMAWNKAYIDLFQFPKDMIHIGIPIEDVIRFNAEKGDMSDEDLEAYVAKRLQYYRAGTQHRFERPWAKDRILELEGNPLPGGGYVTTFNDVTEARKAEAALQETAETLELRVQVRTKELEEANRALETAHAQAEDATKSKTRFLAAASHDLMQPLNAARLYAGALNTDASDDMKPLLQKLDQAIGNADQLIRTLLDISKLDAGGIVPDPTNFSLQDMFDDLTSAFEVQAEEKGLALTVMPTSQFVQTDRGLLLSVLQNFLANAVRYTKEGRILMGCRRSNSSVVITVLDTGPGIADSKQNEVFKEFVRGDTDVETGLGLGLAITHRIAELLETPIALKSHVGRGSAFSITVPVGSRIEPTESLTTAYESRSLNGLSVLCVDNEEAILDSERHLLENWGCRVQVAQSVDDALAKLQENRTPPDFMLLDYHLNDGETGLDVWTAVSERYTYPPATLILTADEGIRKTASLPVLTKPVVPSELFEALTRLVSQKAAQ